MSRDGSWMRGAVGVALALFLALAPAPPPARADDARRDRTYLSELALVVEGARRLIAFSEGNGGDAELAKFAYPLAERYVELANRMLPTSKVAVVHPHVMLVVENLERALDAAAATSPAAYQKRMRIAREELANIEAVLKQLKLRMPELPR